MRAESFQEAGPENRSTLARRPRRTLPDRHGPGRRVLPHHTDPELEAAGALTELLNRVGRPSTSWRLPAP